MEEPHKTHKETSWGWMGALAQARSLSAKKSKAPTNLKPRPAAT